MKLNKQLGYYLPSFFLLHVNTDKNIKDIIGSEDERTLAHELVHFMQDISTIYGLINISNNIDIIRDQNRILRSEPQPISIPIKAHTYSNTTMINKDLFSIYIGDGSESYCEFPGNIKVTSIRNEILEVKHPELYIKNLEIEVGINDNKRLFNFGAASIMESMAHLIENEIYGINTHLLSFPYDAAKLVVEYIYPELSNNIAVIELCEAALMSYHPAEAFVNSLEQMKRENFVYCSANDAYQFVISKNQLEWNGNATSILDEYSRVVTLTINQIESLFTTAPLSEDRWGNDLINKVYELKKSGKSVTSMLFSKIKDYRTNLFNAINFIGFPVARNSKGDYWEQVNIDDGMGYYTPIMFSVILTFKNILENKGVECLLIDYCKDSKLPIISFCYKSPWKIDYLKNRHCRFSGLWRMWGLEGIQLS